MRENGWPQKGARTMTTTNTTVFATDLSAEPSGTGRSNWPGAAATRWPAPPRRVGVALLAAVTFSAAVCGWASRVATPSYPAIVQAERSTVSLPDPVRIERVLVRTGEPIRPGQKLIQFDLRGVRDQIAELTRRQKTLQTRKERLLAEHRQAVLWQRDRIAQEILTLREEVAQLEQERYRNHLEQIALGEVLSEDALATHVALPREVFTDVAEPALPTDTTDDRWLLFRIEAARNAAEVANVRISLCEERIDHLTKLQQSLATAAPPPAEVAAIDAQLADLQMRLQRLQERLKQEYLVADTYGTVGAIACQPGQIVNPGVPLLDIYDTGRPFLVARVPATGDASELLGRRVSVQFPTGIAGGTVHGLLPDSEAARAAALADREHLVSSVLVRIVPSDRLWPDLPVGTSVRVRLASKDPL